MSAQILFINSKTEVCDNFEKIAKNCGWTTDVATDGVQAAAFLKSQEYQLVITGMALKTFDGEQLITYLNKAKPDTVIIVYTGSITPAQLYFLYNERMVFKIFIRPMPFEGEFREAIEEGLELYGCRVAERVEKESMMETDRKQKEDIAGVRKQLVHISDYGDVFQQFVQHMIGKSNEYLVRELSKEEIEVVAGFEMELLEEYQSSSGSLVDFEAMKQALAEEFPEKQGQSVQIVLPQIKTGYQTASIEKLRYMAAIFLKCWTKVFGGYRASIKVELVSGSILALNIRFEQYKDEWDEANEDCVKQTMLLTVQNIADSIGKDCRRVINVNFISYRVEVEMERR